MSHHLQQRPPQAAQNFDLSLGVSGNRWDWEWYRWQVEGAEISLI